MEYEVSIEQLATFIKDAIIKAFNAMDADTEFVLKTSDKEILSIKKREDKGLLIKKKKEQQGDNILLTD